MIPVPRLWPDSTMAVIASGPSLTLEQVEYVRPRVSATIVVNESYRMAPWADVLYGCDGEKFWRWNKGVPSFKGLKYMMAKEKYRNSSLRIPKDIPMLKNAGDRGLSLDPAALCTGQNSAYQAINLSVHFGAKRVVLLGVDMKPGPKGKRHWHEDYPDKSGPNYGLSLQLWPTIVQPLKSIGVEVVNCSPGSDLAVFPRMTLAEALP